jgi:hypothetical protein
MILHGIEDVGGKVKEARATVAAIGQESTKEERTRETSFHDEGGYWV